MQGWHAANHQVNHWLEVEEVYNTKSCGVVGVSAHIDVWASLAGSDLCKLPGGEKQEQFLILLCLLKILSRTWFLQATSFHSNVLAPRLNQTDLR